MAAAATLTDERPSTLDGAIRDYIANGETDPLTIWRKLVRRYGSEWVNTQVQSLAPELVGGRIRRLLTAERTSVTLAVQRDGMSRGQEPEERILDVARWVPNVGYKRVADLTAEDCHVIAHHYARLAKGYAARAIIFERFAELIEQSKVNRLADVKVPLNLDELRELTEG